MEDEILIAGFNHGYILQIENYTYLQSLLAQTGPHDTEYSTGLMQGMIMAAAVQKEELRNKELKNRNKGKNKNLGKDNGIEF